MLSRHKLLLLIPAILLIPILFGMIPLNMAHKISEPDVLFLKGSKR